MTKKKLRKYNATLDSASSSSSLLGQKTPSDQPVKKSSPSSGQKRNKIAVFREFLTDVRAEFDRVSWPGKKEVKSLTIAVLGITFFFTLYLGIVDITLSELVGYLMKS